MPEDHLPDLRHARNWLDRIRTDLLELRDWLRSDVEGSGDFIAELETHAATLGDIIARGEVVPQAPAGDIALLTSQTLRNAALALRVQALPDATMMADSLDAAAGPLADVERALREGRDDIALRTLRDLMPWASYTRERSDPDPSAS